ncbi:MAG: GntR family transcriptional regulator, partial [Subdoligranulum sp.]|nr:GntR family transcriptional regulator [Subdoligranulum sp.]
MSQLAKQPVITGPDDAYRYLRRRIIDFTLLPGEFLSENALAAQMGTSRATVREAIARLAEEGC